MQSNTISLFRQEWDNSNICSLLNALFRFFISVRMVDLSNVPTPIFSSSPYPLNPLYYHQDLQW